MHNMALSWQQAAWVAIVLGGLAGALAIRPSVRRRPVSLLLREAAIVAALYTVWQLAGTLSVTGTSGAFDRARWIEHLERTLRLPSEAAVQHALTGHRLAAQAANLYYAGAHFTVMFAFLVWLFARHREQFRPVRRVLALTTFACLVIQLLPVAPPRLLPGYTDTAAQYGQSVYSLGFGADQLSAMPSVHVAWAVLVGAVTLRLGGRAGRWLGPVHAVLTVVVVVATANHFWADGVVAVLVLAGCTSAERAVRRWWTQRHGESRVEQPARGEDPALMEAS